MKVKVSSHTNQPVVRREEDQCVVDHSSLLQGCQKVSYGVVKLQQCISICAPQRPPSCPWTRILGVVGVLEQERAEGVNKFLYITMIFLQRVENVDFPALKNSLELAFTCKHIFTLLKGLTDQYALILHQMCFCCLHGKDSRGRTVVSSWLLW